MSQKNLNQWLAASVVIALVAGAFLLGRHFFAPSPNIVLHTRADAFSEEPTVKNARKLLNVRADGAYAYLKCALVGRAFADEPAVFEAISKDLKTKCERFLFKYLSEKGDDVFEYHSDLKPSNFEEVFNAQKWLKKAATRLE